MLRGTFQASKCYGNPRVFAKSQIVDVINEMVHMYNDIYFSSDHITLIAPYAIINEIMEAVTKIDNKRPYIISSRIGIIFANIERDIVATYGRVYKSDYMRDYVLPYILFITSPALLSYLRTFITKSNNVFIYNKNPGKLRLKKGLHIWNRKALYISYIGRGFDATYSYDNINDSKAKFINVFSPQIDKKYVKFARHASHKSICGIMLVVNMI